MTLYVCLDDRGGMLFNGRRQSRDAAVLEDIRASIPDTLTIDPFSEKLIASAQIPFQVLPEDIAQLSENAHFFLENRHPAEVFPQCTQLVIYRWNRHYPADLRWDIDLEKAGFRLAQTTEFSGKSHERITKEVYIP